MVKHVGTQIIETPRLMLRKFRIEDANEMFNNWAKDPSNIKYLSWGAHKSVEETKEILKRWISEYDSEKAYRWCIELKKSGEVIGGIDVVHMHEDVECCEIGYVLSKKYWNNGIMTEALKAVLGYLFNEAHFHRIQLRHDVGNEASGRVMLKNGLKREGVLRECEKTVKGEWRDMVIYSILKNEFKEENK